MTGAVNEVYFVVPDGIDDLGRPSGGNAYDRRVSNGLATLGWSVHEVAVFGRWPLPEPVESAAVAAALARIPSGGLVLIDGLIASAVPEALHMQTDRLCLVVLLHMVRDEQSELEALSAASAVVATSEWTKRWCCEDYGLARDRLRVVPPGVDPVELAAGSPSGDHLLCVGAVTTVKGHDRLLDALEVVADLGWHCTCVGALDVDAAFAETVRQRAEDRGLDDRVRFTGVLTGGALDEAYARADALILASRAEAYGMVVTEALARGLPVIASDIGGVPEAMGSADDGRQPGLLVPPDDPHALARALRDWLTEPKERARLRATARSRRQTLVDWPETSRLMSTVLSEVAASGAAGASLLHPV